LASIYFLFHKKNYERNQKKTLIYINKNHLAIMLSSKDQSDAMKEENNADKQEKICCGYVYPDQLGASCK